MQNSHRAFEIDIKLGEELKTFRVVFEVGVPMPGEKSKVFSTNQVNQVIQEYFSPINPFADDHKKVEELKKLTKVIYEIIKQISERDQSLSDKAIIYQNHLMVYLNDVNKIINLE
ncbi:MAG: hypothetical protein ACP5N7_02490 [Candidatus Pacearchaeota archaeon]